MKQKPYDHLFPMWEHKEEIVQYIKDNFDFDRVLNFMKKTKWKYGDKKKERTPTLQDIYEVIDRVLGDGTFFSEKYSSSCGCGGFQFEYTPNWLSVRFGYDKFWSLFSDKKRVIIAQARIVEFETIVARMDIGNPEIKEIEFKKGPRRFGLKIGDYFVKTSPGKAYTKKEAEIIKEFLDLNYHRFNVSKGGL
jgi:hypothetical protein